MSATTAATPDLTSVNSGVPTTNIFFFLVIPVAILCYTYWKLSRRHLNDLADLIPGPNGYPIIGNALEFLGTSPGKIY